MTERLICLIRHPRVAVPEGVCYGASDVALAVDVAPIANAIRPQLPETFGLISSPASRCLTLARALAPAPAIDARLAEIDFGDWEMRRFDALPREDIDRWAADVWNFRPPGGESAAGMAQRAWAAWLDFLASGPDNCVVVAHGGPLRVIAGRLLGLPRETWLGLGIGPGSVTRLMLDASGAHARFDEPAK